MAEKKVAAKKAPVKKVAVKPAAKEVKAAPVTNVAATLSVALFDAAGKEKGSVKLPETVFGGKINKPLMAQAVRVYLANQRMGAAKTKTRGQVDGSTRKIYRQKGTGRARHGGIRAPIFVGGGIAHGPKARDYSLDLPTKMKRAALASSLSLLAKEGHVMVVSGLSALEPKTKLVVSCLKGMGLAGKKALVLMPEYNEKVLKSARNIDRVGVGSVTSVATYDVLNAGTLVVMQEALPVLEKHFAGSKKETK